jgi:ATP-dependent DNA ligase
MLNPQFCFPPKPTSTGSKPPDESFYRIAKLSPNFVIEKKLDGFACVIVKLGDKFTFYTREKRLLDLSIIPEASQQLQALSLPENLVIGGEAIGRRTKIKDVLYLYAVYYANGTWFTNVSLEENRATLKSIIKSSGKIQVAEYFTEKQCSKKRFDQFYFDNINCDDVEGVILKDVQKPVKLDFTKTLILPWWFKFKAFDT